MIFSSSIRRVAFSGGVGFGGTNNSEIRFGRPAPRALAAAFSSREWRGNNFQPPPDGYNQETNRSGVTKRSVHEISPDGIVVMADWPLILTA
jgi:hypothetical protein